MPEPAIELPVDRAKSVTRALSWGVPAVLLLVCATAVFGRLQFVPTAFSNRLVDYSIALLLVVPGVLLAIACVIKSLQWLLLAFWPGKVGVVAQEHELTLRLGPFGTKRYDMNRCDVRYPFEMDDEENEGRFEAYLPEDRQRSSLLPRIVASDTSEPVDRLILRFASGSESDLAVALRPMIDRWRTNSERRTANSQ